MNYSNSILQEQEINLISKLILNRKKKQTRCSTKHRTCYAMMPVPTAILILNFNNFFRHLIVPLLPLIATLYKNRFTGHKITQKLFAAIAFWFFYVFRFFNFENIYQLKFELVPVFMLCVIGCKIYSPAIYF